MLIIYGKQDKIIFIYYFKKDKNEKTLGALSVITAIVLTGCGTDSVEEVVKAATEETQSTSKDPNTNNGAGAEGDFQQDPLKNGNFVDSPIADADFKTSSGISGKTGEFGNFSYKKGDKVVFRFGDMIIGEAVPDEKGLVLLSKMIKDPDKKVLVARIIQSLDKDKNTENGIQFDEKIKSMAPKVDLQDLTLGDIKNALESDEFKELMNVIDSDKDGEIDIPSSDAIAHMEDSENIWLSGGENG